MVEPLALYDLRSRENETDNVAFSGGYVCWGENKYIRAASTLTNCDVLRGAALMTRQEQCIMTNVRARSVLQ